MSYLINTPCGAVQGVAGKHPGTAAYKGIRYAAAGRWEYPTVVDHWEGIYDASAYGSCAYQPAAFQSEGLNSSKSFYYHEFREGIRCTYSEDCLFLNIFTPENAKPGDNLPVILYIHGGSFVSGFAHEKPFDEPIWPAKGVIGVTINYRLGPLGFLCLPELKEEAGFTGNYGLYDQAAAMQWVQRNIASFGGDPENVTIMGQSAGAMSVQQHSLSPYSEGLFQKAVMSSGAGVHKALSAAPTEKTYDFWHKTMEIAGCADLAAFRALDPEALFTAWERAKKQMKGGGCFPCMDGRLIVGVGTELLAAEKQHQIPYMAGSASEDMMPPILYSMASSWISAQPKPSYLWYFDRQLPGDRHGAWHSSDLWYWFGTLDNCWRPWEKKDRLLSEQMADYLCSFARTGNPNAPRLPKWESTPGKALLLGEKRTKMGSPSRLKMALTMLTNKPVGD